VAAQLRTDPDRTASTKGVLRPVETATVAGLVPDHPVAPPLQPFIERYWSVRWDRRGLPGFRSEVLSHPCVNLSVETGERPRFGHVLPAVLVHGVVTRRFVVDLIGAGRVTAAKFRPGGFAAFTGVQPSPNSVTLLSDEFAARGRLEPRQLLSAVLAEEDDGSRAAVLDQALAPLAPDPPRAYLELLDLLGDMLTDRTIVRVEQAAARGGLTVRSLQRLFATYLGIGPKAVLARYRLQDAVTAIDAGQVDDLAGLSAELGWSDQAHFSREFRAVVGTTPSAYLSRSRGSGS
jgi:AraC-like DNA-binding protein